MNKRIYLACLLIAVIFLTACGSTVSPYKDIPKPSAVITFEDGSTMTFILDPASAPNTVSNFINLANSGYYDGMKIDTIYPTYFLKSGDPVGDGTGGPGYTIEGEFTENGYRFNQLSHNRGVISMCRLDYDPNSAGSQFFIMQSPHLEYDGKYAAFGWIDPKDTVSLQTLDNICGVTLDKSFRPIVRFTISSIRVDTKGYEYVVVKYGIPEIVTTTAPTEEGSNEQEQQNE